MFAGATCRFDASFLLRPFLTSVTEYDWRTLRSGSSSDVTWFGVVEERARVHDLRGEPELVRDVFDRVAVVVDAKRVEHVVTELVEVRSAVGRFERDPVGNDVDLVGFVRRDECVHVGVVGDGVFSDQWCFPVARRVGERHAGRDSHPSEADRDQTATAMFRHMHLLLLGDGAPGSAPEWARGHRRVDRGPDSNYGPGAAESATPITTHSSPTGAVTTSR